MFCPNCGRDCGEDEFCVACGTARAKRVARYCPRCRSDKVHEGERNMGGNSYLLAKGYVSILSVLFRALLRMDGGDIGYVCEECGCFWSTEEQGRMNRYAQIFSAHMGTYSEITVNAPEGELLRVDTFGIGLFGPDGYGEYVRYEDLGAVQFQKCFGPLYGWVTVRRKSRRMRPFPRNLEEARRDRMTVLCGFEEEACFGLVNRLLMDILEENKKLLKP